MMEAAPSAAFIVTKPDLLLELLVVALDTPAQFGKIDEPAEAKVCRQRREPILGRLGSSPVVCPAKAGMFSRRQTWRGRSQSPVVWIAEVMETETLKPIDKVSPGEATSHRP